MLELQLWYNEYDSKKERVEYEKHKKNGIGRLQWGFV